MIAALTTDPRVMAATAYASWGPGRVRQVRTWGRLLWLVRERPVTGLVVDTARIPRATPIEEPLVALHRRFASVGIVLVARPDLSPGDLLRLGRAGIWNLTPTHLDGVRVGIERGLRRSRGHATVGHVLRALGDRVPTTPRMAVGHALDAVPCGWQADQLARAMGWTRAHLSVRLKACGLPSAGHLLAWARMLHAGRWLSDAGRTGESVSRQLGYANGATFRRALHRYAGGTPTEIRQAGGLSHVLHRFLDECGLGDSLDDDLSAA